MNEYSLRPSRLYISEIQEEKILDRVNFFYVAFAYSFLIVFIGFISIMSILLFVESATSGGSINDNPASTLLIPTAFSLVAGYLVKGVPSLIAFAPKIGEARIEDLWDKPLFSALTILLLLSLSSLGIYLSVGMAMSMGGAGSTSATDLFLAFISGRQPLELPLMIFFTIILAGGASLFATSLVLIYYTSYPWVKGLHASIWRLLFAPILKLGNVEDALKNRCPQCCHEEFKMVEFQGKSYCSCICCGLVKGEIKDSAGDPTTFYQIESEQESGLDS